MPLRFSMTKRRAILLQVGVGILLFILFVGTLNSIAYTSRVPILSTDDISNVVTIAITWVNTTSGAQKGVVYTPSSIAIASGEKLYIAIPQRPSGYDAIKEVHIVFNATLEDLVERGFNYVELYIDTDAKHAISYTDPTIIGIATGTVDYSHDPAKPFTVFGFMVEPLWQGRLNNLTFPARFNKTIDVNLFALKAAAWGSSNPVKLFIGGLHGQVFTASYIVISVKLYAISEKPVLKALTEPIYSFFAAVYAVLLAVIRKVKEYVVSAFGGFASQFTLTGLIGDPVIALILTMVFITVLFLVLRPRRR